MEKNMEQPQLTDTSSSDQLNSIYQFIAGIVEARYPDLAAHLFRIKEFVTLFAQYASLTVEETSILSIGAGIHDIGKLSISDYILNKPAKLSAIEFAIVQKHVDFGAKFLEPLNLDPRINEIVLYHHENYDGSGYPEKRAGDEIPYLARMVRILDTFDALTEDRPYHLGISYPDAIKVIHNESRLYDPRLLECFFDMVSHVNQRSGEAGKI